MSAVEEKIRTLRDRFAGTLPDRVAEIRRTWMRLCDKPAVAEMHRELELRFHTLGGTAGTYGIATVAGLSIEGELTCASLDPDPDPEAIAYLATIVEDIGEAVDTWLEQTPSLSPSLPMRVAVSSSGGRHP